MKKALLLMVFAIAPLAAIAQISTTSIVPVTVVPSGSCTANVPLKLLVPAGILYSCQNGTYGVTGPVPDPTPTTCLAATTVAAPCIAYQGSFTALGVSGTTGVQTLYTSNAPAGATFQFCPLVFISSAGSGGTIAVQATYTTPGGQSRSTSTIGPTANLTSTGLQFSTCIPLAVAGSSTLSFAVLAISGTGTPVWETEPVVMRIH